MPRRTWQPGDTPPATDLADLTRRSVQVYATPAARQAALTAPAAGQLTFTLDTGQLDYWTGSTWQPALSAPAMPLGAPGGTVPYRSPAYFGTGTSGVWTLRQLQIGLASSTWPL